MSALLDQFSQLASGAIMNTVRFAWKLTRTKQAINPSQVLTDRAFARDPLLYDSSLLRRYDVVDETVVAQVNRVLPKALF